MGNKISLEELEKLIRSAVDDEEYWSLETRQTVIEAVGELISFIRDHEKSTEKEG